MVGMLWHEVVLSSLQRSASRKAGAGDAQEDALFRWIVALDVANDRLELAVPRVEGFSSLLMPLAQVALISRVDYCFHQNILAVGSSDRSAAAFGGGGWIVPLKLLPFAIEGRVSFQTGMQLKMAVMHLTDWANSHDLRDSDGMLLYPYMRSDADTLMMKKDLLLDPETRASVCAGLSMRSLLHILQQFAPDEFSPSPIDLAIIEHLKVIASRSPAKEDVLQDYVAPSADELREWSERDALMQRRRRGPMGTDAHFELQIGDDSDTELQELAAQNGRLGARFRAVQELWGGTYDRRNE
jgi:DIL domain